MQSFLTAIAMMLVIEGILPFLNPAGLRRTLLMLAEQDDRALRVMGLISMVAGVILLYIVH